MELNRFDKSARSRLHYFFQCQINQIVSFFEKAMTEEDRATFMLPQELEKKTRVRNFKEIKHKEPMILDLRTPDQKSHDIKAKPRKTLALKMDVIKERP